MQQKGWLMLRVLLNRFHEGTLESIVKSVAPEDLKMILNQNITSKDIAPVLASPAEILKNIHYSWFQAQIEKLPEQVRRTAVSLLPDPLKSKLQASGKFK